MIQTRVPGSRDCACNHHPMSLNINSRLSVIFIGLYWKDTLLEAGFMLSNFSSFTVLSLQLSLDISCLCSRA